MNNWITGIFLVAGVLLALTGCEQNQQTTNGNGTDGPVIDANYEDYEEKLQRPLFDVAVSGSPNSTADKLQLESHSFVQVAIDKISPEAILPVGYLILVEFETERSIQAWVPIEQLLELANEEVIEYIRAPVRPLRP
jgi:hypothetical protein